MPEALATSKRKFYKVLDNLSAPSSSSSASTTGKRPLSVASTTSSAPTTHKRASVLSTASAALVEPTAKRLRPSTSSTTLASLRSLHARNASASISQKSARSIGGDTKDQHALTEEKKSEAPHFTPWSHETFLKRLKTFAPVTQWHPKPEDISEVEWAKRGWECVDVNAVSCRGGCGKRVMVRLDPRPRRSTRQSEEAGTSGQRVAEGVETREEDNEEEEGDMDEQFETALVQKYKSLIIDGHAESCLWRRAGCKDDIYRLPIVRTSVWQPELRSRYSSLLAMPDAICKVQLKPIPEDARPSAERLLTDLRRLRGRGLEALFRCCRFGLVPLGRVERLGDL